jgi:hypothetical protein
MGKYKVDLKQFNKVREKIEKYKSIGHICKNVRCIETGQIFETAKAASRWLSYVKENYYNKFNPDLIKQCCRGKQKTSYGYHWEFVKD